MKLTGEQLLPLFHGYLDCNYDVGTSYVHLHRFLRSQRDAYLSKGPKTLRRCFASANIYLDVVTDSTRLRLSFYAKNASAVSYAGFDLYVDGVFADRRFFRDWRIDEVYFPLPDDGQRHRVTLYLPWSCAVTPGWLELDADAAFEPVQRAGRGMVFGDSITQGYTTLMPSLSYANTLGRDLDAEIINQGAGGFYFDESTLDPALADYAPEFLVIAYGTNDFSRNSAPAVFRAAAKAYIDRFHQIFPGRRIYGVLPLFRSDSNVADPQPDARYTFAEAREMLAELYAAYPDITLLRETGIPHIHEAFAEDCVHPTDFGHLHIAKSLERIIRQGK